MQIFVRLLWLLQLLWLVQLGFHRLAVDDSNLRASFAKGHLIRVVRILQLVARGGVRFRPEGHLQRRFPPKPIAHSETHFKALGGFDFWAVVTHALLYYLRNSFAENHLIRFVRNYQRLMACGGIQFSPEGHLQRRFLPKPIANVETYFKALGDSDSRAVVDTDTSFPTASLFLAFSCGHDCSFRGTSSKLCSEQ